MASCAVGWLPGGLLTGMYALFLGMLWYDAPRLPERVASHFDAAGVADGWMSRITYLIVMAVFGLLFPLFVPLLSWAVRAAPASMINLPHRDYWLAREHRGATNAFLFRHALWLASLQMGLVIVIHRLTLNANRQDPPHLSNLVWAVLGVFLASTVVWGWQFVHHFRQPPAAAVPDA